MKTRIITLLLAISAIIGSASAQEYDRKVDLYKNGAVLESYDITDVDSIKFRRIDYVKAEYKVLPSGTGNVTIDGSTTTPKYVVPGTNVTYVATAKSGYKFKGWNMEGVEISTSNTLILPINSNTEITAVFQNIPNYSVTVVSSGNGTAVASKSSVQEGGSVTLTATPNSGYVFKNWTLNGNVVSTQNPYTATVTANSVYVANFEKIYTVSVSSTTGGTATTSSNSVVYGGNVILKATPNEGYKFVNWTVNGEEVSTENPYTATITANTEFVANFESKISFSGWYRIKEVTTGKYLNAYRYTSSTSNTGGVNLADYSVDLGQIFTFVESGTNYTLKTRSGYNIVCQQYNVDALKEEGTELKITQITYNGQLAIKINLAYPSYYQEDGAFKVEEVFGTYYPFCDAADSNIATWVLEEVSFDPEQKCSVSVISTDGGTVATTATEVEMYTAVTLTATPNNGYKFKNWTLDGEVVSTDNPYTATITEDTEFVANFSTLKGEENGHTWIDLGLSVKWATCNVGANSPEEYGDYFAWGETAPKTTYNWSNYKYCNGTYNSITKYCTKSSHGTVDNKTTLELSDDAAYVNWGGNWRMPTAEEINELMDINNCTWEWNTQNGVKGFKVTSKRNGNSIFLPAAGWYGDISHDDGNSLLNSTEAGAYWSNSIGTNYDSMAWDFFFWRSSGVGSNEFYRCFGQSVRAVCE